MFAFGDASTSALRARWIDEETFKQLSQNTKERSIMLLHHIRAVPRAVNLVKTELSVDLVECGR